MEKVVVDHDFALGPDRVFAEIAFGAVVPGLDRVIAPGLQRSVAKNLSRVDAEG